eukprot:gnl/TRDRNA2_/TRDRNA2_39038_c0_seq1.p1 gnl/TRDRNA2_/TRDRNA2_39038_c0~~gnl/TRDRNA2_/TRDRNA2_39038_c0_seq1.p1  ORF type:complete len:249 (+),score=30.42 gnl/TRDRNA2_/TRDRNA2_39038_c0_seq1:108-854(+)
MTQHHNVAATVGTVVVLVSITSLGGVMAEASTMVRREPVKKHEHAVLHAQDPQVQPAETPGDMAASIGTNGMVAMSFAQAGEEAAQLYDLEDGADDQVDFVLDEQDRFEDAQGGNATLGGFNWTCLRNGHAEYSQGLTTVSGPDNNCWDNLTKAQCENTCKENRNRMRGGNCAFYRYCTGQQVASSCTQDNGARCCIKTVTGSLRPANKNSHGCGSTARRRYFSTSGRNDKCGFFICYWKPNRNYSES